jgi:FixJ family two-component response regulator
MSWLVNPIPTVFVVDDDVGSRRTIEAMAAAMGVASASYASAEEFLQSFDARQPGCLVTDLRMPGMSGLELQEKLNEMQIRIPVMLMTAYADVPVTVQAMEQGAIMVLEKPCFDTQLWEALSKALEVDARRREEENARREAQDRLRELTAAERQVLDMVVEGLPNKTIAKRVDVSVRTVENRRQSIFRKLGVTSVASLVQAVLLAEGRLSE